MSAGSSGASVSLVVSDVDGTLIDFDMQMPPTTRAALVELERRGIPVLLATALNGWSVEWLFGPSASRCPRSPGDGKLCSTSCRRRRLPPGLSLM
jgi:hypothetical protein